MVTNLRDGPSCLHRKKFMSKLYLNKLDKLKDKVNFMKIK